MRQIIDTLNKIILGLLLAACCFCLPSQLFAQEEEQDTLSKVIESYPAESSSEEEIYGTEDDEQGEQEYFIRNSIYEAGQDSVRKRELPARYISSLREDEDFWYANTVFEKEQQQFRSGGLSTLTWVILVTAFVGILVWFIVNSNIGYFKRSRKSVMVDHEMTQPEERDIFAINYDTEIARAAQSGDYRLAIRLHFLQLLKNLSERNIIQYKKERTNFDYLLQLRPTTYYRDFFHLARNYEYAWYGKFDIPGQAFEQLKQDFENFNRHIGRY